MTGHIRTIRPARAAIAAVLAFTATPLLAQDIVPPAVTPSAAPSAAPEASVVNDPGTGGAGRGDAGKHDARKHYACNPGVSTERACRAVDRPG